MQGVSVALTNVHVQHRGSRRAPNELGGIAHVQRSSRNARPHGHIEGSARP